MSDRVRILNPMDDGITHIDIYTKGKTRLGRLLTNLADIPVHHPIYGTFRCAEGLWYYLKTGCQFECLRAMTGFEAKKFGTSKPTVWMDDFKEQFKLGLINKIVSHQELYEAFVSSELPFEHYYFYSSNKPNVPPKVIEPKDVRWLTEFFTELRAKWKREAAEREAAKKAQRDKDNERPLE